jgi:hypothetical protein
MAIEDLVPFVQNLLRVMPVVLQLFEIAVLIIAVFFFGGIAVRGFARKPWWLRLPMVAASGIVCLLAAPVVGVLIAVDFGPLEMFQPGLFLGGLISAIVLAVGFRLLTSGLGDDRYLKLWNEIECLKDALVGKKVLKRLTEGEARKIAAEAAEAKPVSGRLADDVWDIKLLKGGKKEVRVLLDSLTGEVREVLWFRSRVLNFLLADRLRVAGLIVLVAFGVLTAAGFRGFPSLAGPFEGLGLGQDFFQKLAEAGDQFSKPPAGCISMYELQGMIDKDNPPPQHKDDAARQLFEDRSGAAVADMFLVEKGGVSVVLAVMENNNICYSQEGEFCGCGGGK